MKYKRVIYKNYLSDLWESYYINNKGKYVHDRVGLSLADIRDDLKADGYKYDVITKKESLAYQDIDDIIKTQNKIDRSLKNWTDLKKADKFALKETIDKFGEEYRQDEYNKKISRFKKVPQIFKEIPQTILNKTYALYTKSKSKFWLSLPDFKHLKKLYQSMQKPSRLDIILFNLDVIGMDIQGIISGKLFSNIQKFQNDIALIIQFEGDANGLEDFDIDHIGKIKIQLQAVL